MTPTTLWRRSALGLSTALAAVTLAGCVVVPVPHARSRGVVVVEQPGYGPPPHHRHHHHRDRHDRRHDRHDRYDHHGGR